MDFEDITVGQRVAWIRLPRDGFAVPMAAIVLRTYFSRGGAPRVRIKVPLAHGSIERCVSPDTLRERAW